MDSQHQDNSDAGIERAIVAAGAIKGPRITPEHIQSVIVSVHYFTAKDGQNGVDCGYDPANQHPALELLTFCVLVLRNGFTVVGKSACASPENFNEEIGRRVARADAEQQIWPLEGYLLREQLFQRTQPAQAPTGDLF